MALRREKHFLFFMSTKFPNDERLIRFDAFCSRVTALPPHTGPGSIRCAHQALPRVGAVLAIQ
jgi:hypothetical protein